MNRIRKCLKVVMKQLRVEKERWIKGKRQFVRQEEGEGFIDVLVKMLIVVVVGAALLAIMRAAIPDLFSGMMDKIRSIFEV